MAIKFTRKQYLEVWRDGRYISRHTSVLECGESASADAQENGEGDYEVRVGMEVFYVVSIRHLTSRSISGLTIFPANPPVNNNPPVWDTQPAPVFTLGTASNVELDDLTSDPDLDTVTVSLNTGAATLPTGVTWNDSLDRLEYDGVGAITTTTGHIATANDGIDTTDSDSFSVVIRVADAVLFPLLATSRGGSKNWSQDGTLALDDRAVIGQMDICLLFGIVGPPQMDIDPPPVNWLSRAVCNQEILDAHATSEHTLFTYMNHMEAKDVASDIKTFVDAVNGPGTTDGWVYNSSQVKVSFFPGVFGINISSYVAVDGNGQRFPEWHTDNEVENKYVAPLIAAGVAVGGINACNVFVDNAQIHANKSGADWDQLVGGNDDAQDFYDPENAAHVTADPIAVIAYSGFRTNSRLGVELFKTNHPNAILNGNTNQWAESFTGEVSGLRNVLLEYRVGGDTGVGYLQGGFSENNSNDTNPRSGVGPDGLTRSGGGTWQRTYNNIYLSVNVASEPKLVFAAFRVQCLQTGTNGDGGQKIWPNIPASNAKWSMVRWSKVTAWLAGAHSAISGVQVGSQSTGRGRSTPLFDEDGLINIGTTKLFHKWMGEAKVAPQTDQQVTHGDGEIWWAEYDNALIILNTDNDSTNSAFSLDTTLLPGGTAEWKHFNGSQDSAKNDDSDLTATESMPPVDGVILVRKSWYDAL